MGRTSVLAALLILCGNAAAAPVAGHVSFVSRRGQKPVVNETLVWAEPLNADLHLKPRAAGHFTLDTTGKTLVPHVLAIPVGSTVNFPNHDPISHNLFSLSQNNSFDLGIYRRDAGKSHTFTNPGLVNVYCNVHPNMSAVIQVMASPYYTFADANGSFTLDLPPDRYRLIAWNEQGGTTEMTLNVPAGGTKKADVTIDSRSFHVPPHTNKQGKPYQAPREY